MLRRVKEWGRRKLIEHRLREYPHIREHVYPRVGEEHAKNLEQVLREHGPWIENTLSSLAQRERVDAVEKIAQIVSGYVRQNPRLISKLRPILPRDERELARILALVEPRKDHREMVGQIVLYSQIGDEAKRTEMRKLLDVLTPEEKKLLWIKIHNHAVLSLPRTAIKSVLNEIAHKRPDLRDTVERILSD